MSDVEAGPTLSTTRVLQIQQRLAVVRAEVARAAESVGRSADEVALIVVTKTFPVADIRALHALGVGDCAENKPQELSAKADQLRDLSLRWHFVGQLQTNKAAAVARVAAMVHSVDRQRLVDALARGTQRALDEGLRSGPLECLIQVQLDHPPRPDRGGAQPAQVLALAEAISAYPSLHLAGVMAVAPLDVSPKSAFTRLRGVSCRLRAQFPDASAISAGMSTDFAEAITRGATHVRVGGAILGSRYITH